MYIVLPPRVLIEIVYMWDFHKGLEDKYLKSQEAEGKHSLTNTTKAYEVVPVTLPRVKLVKKEVCTLLLNPSCKKCILFLKELAILFKTC